jgi:hypothetical protein
MKTQEILSIIGLSCLGLCLLLCLLKMSMKDKKGQANCDKSCGMLFFAAAVLIGVSQLLKETSEPYGDGVKCKSPSGSGNVCPSDHTLCQNMGMPPGCNSIQWQKSLRPVNDSMAPCYKPDINGCGDGGGGGGGGSKCGPPPGVPVPNISSAPLFAGNDQLCSEAAIAIKKLPGWDGWSVDKNCDFIKRNIHGQPIACPENDCGSEFMCDKKAGHCASTGDGSYPNYTCADGEMDGVAIKGNFGFCETQVPGGSTGRCGISKNPSPS